MKTYVIASTEYKANMPDLFLMDENGNYYGVTDHSYALWDNFPKSVDHWHTREGSDAGRYFNIDEVELPAEKVERFEYLTQKHRELNKKIEEVAFPEKAPSSKDYKTYRSYIIASNKWLKRLDVWREEHDFKNLLQQRADAWKERILLFTSFSQKVYEAIKYNNNIKYV